MAGWYLGDRQSAISAGVYLFNCKELSFKSLDELELDDHHRAPPTQPSKHNIKSAEERVEKPERHGSDGTSVKKRELAFFDVQETAINEFIKLQPELYTTKNTRDVDKAKKNPLWNTTGEEFGRK